MVPPLRLARFPVASIILSAKDWLFVLDKLLRASDPQDSDAEYVVYVARALQAAGVNAPGRYDIIATRIRERLDRFVVESGVPEPDPSLFVVQIFTSADAVAMYKRYGVLLRSVDPVSGDLDFECLKCGLKWTCGAESNPPQTSCPSCGPQPESQPST